MIFTSMWLIAELLGDYTSVLSQFVFDNADGGNTYVSVLWLESNLVRGGAKYIVFIVQGAFSYAEVGDLCVDSHS